MNWTPADIPDLAGKVAVVTGATSGLGLETTRALAGRGAHVVLATRNVDKTARVMAHVREETPAASLEHLPLDLADLRSVEDAAATLAERHGHLDRLVNNAGVMAPPYRTTVQGFELQFGLNHLGHFAFTTRLLPLLRATPGARVVSVSSGAHRMGRINFDDLNSERGYQRWRAYGQSKLANLLFTLELQRRFEEAGDHAIAVAAHPGWAATELQTTGPTMDGGLRAAVTGVFSRLGNTLLAQNAKGGALPILYASTAPGVTGMSYWGPTGPGEMRGGVGPADRTRRALDPETARRLWDVSEQLTGVVTPSA